HHPRPALPHLAPPALEEGPAAPPEDHRPEHRADPVDAREVELVAEPVHDHRAGRDDRDAEDQAPPEPPAEQVLVMAGVLPVTAVLAVAGVLRVVHRHGVLLTTRGCPPRAITARGLTGWSADYTPPEYLGLRVGRLRGRHASSTASSSR